VWLWVEEGRERERVCEGGREEEESGGS
jgi:hypothetical protein